MPLTEWARQLRDDAETFRAIYSQLETLAVEWASARKASGVRTRGYFTPGEEDRLRQILLAYRSYRAALYEIVYRHADYEEIECPEQRMRAFVTAFAAGLTLYGRSLQFIRAYEHEPVLRRKLNEADAQSGLPAGFFEEVLAAYSSFHHYRLVLRAQRFWLSHRRAARQQALAGDTEVEWLGEVIRAERAAVRRCFRDLLLHRLRHDWRALWATLLKPVRLAGHGLQSLLAAKFAGLRITPHYSPALDAAVLTKLRPLLAPGDILLVRADHKLTNALFPGFWIHGAIFLDAASACVPSRYGAVIEAVAPRVAVRPLEKCLHADHVAVLRPRLSRDELNAALHHALSHLGKPFDFEFDFNVSSRMVCTELIYRSFHGRGGIDFRLTKRLGRFTLTGDDIAATFLRGHARESAACGSNPLELVALASRCDDGTARFYEGTDAAAHLQRIRDGRSTSGLSVPVPSPTHVQHE